MSSFTSVGQMTDAMFDSIEAIHAAEDAGVDYWGTNAAEEAAKVAVQHRIENPVEVVVDNGTKVNKKQIAIDIYKSLDDTSRKSVMTALVAAGFKSATASTYAANLRGNKWS